MAVEQALVIGTGTMGPGIAQVLAMGGYDTVLCGRTDESVAAGLERARLAAANLLKAGLASAAEVDAAARRLSGSTDLEDAAANAGVIVESVVESIEVKRECFRRLDAAAAADAVLATNTSGLRITDIAAGLERPGRVAGMHWWNPPYLMPLVEVVSGERTAPETVETVVNIARDLGKEPVVVRQDVPGFIGNRLQYALLSEAVRLVETGVASAEDVDRAMRSGPGLRYAALGPLEAADFIGLDVVADIMSYLLPALHASLSTPGLLKELVREGKLGSKSAGGFYDYTDESEAERLGQRDERLAELLRAGLGR
jgi:3-hydroxyacyl-CoA dehydrogenase